MQRHAIARLNERDKSALIVAAIDLDRRPNHIIVHYFSRSPIRIQVSDFDADPRIFLITLEAGQIGPLPPKFFLDSQENFRAEETKHEFGFSSHAPPGATCTILHTCIYISCFFQLHSQASQ